MRRAALLAIVFAVVLGEPAGAKGSAFTSDRWLYRPGNEVTLVGITAGGALGWIDDGPFYGYLNPSNTPSLFGNEGVPVGRIAVEPVGQSVRASITFGPRWISSRGPTASTTATTRAPRGWAT